VFFCTVIIRCPENFDHPVFEKDMNNAVDILFHSLKFEDRISLCLQVERYKERKPIAKIYEYPRPETIGKRKKDRKLQTRYDEQNNPEY
jgi:hypothetical protein